MGIEDSAILGGVLAQPEYSTTESLPRALKLYEDLRIKRAAMVAENSVTSRYFTQMEDGPEQVKRDEWLLAHPGIQVGHINIRSRKEFLDELFGYDAYRALADELAKERGQTETSANGSGVPSARASAVLA